MQRYLNLNASPLVLFHFSGTSGFYNKISTLWELGQGQVFRSKSRVEWTITGSCYTMIWVLQVLSFAFLMWKVKNGKNTDFNSSVEVLRELRWLYKINQLCSILKTNEVIPLNTFPSTELSKSSNFAAKNRGPWKQY